MALSKLPGGLPVWRARRLLRRARSSAPRRDDGTLSCAGVVVTAQRHPRLHALVTDAAGPAKTPVPQRVRLGGAAEVAIDGDTLVVGLPLVWGLSADQLRAVVAHELALPPLRRVRHLGLVRRLLRSGLDDRLRAAVEQARDAAAIAAYGGGFAAVDEAAVALFRAEAVRDGFDAFAGTAGAHEVDGRPVRVADLHAGWHTYLLATGAPGTTWDPVVATQRIPQAHPGLRPELRALADGEASHHNGLAPDAVALDDLDAADWRVLAEDVLLPGTDPGNWLEFADLPAAVYTSELERDARRAVQVADVALGHPPADRDELARALLDRATGPSWLGAALLAGVVEYTLVGHGWRREHPAIPRRLRAPDGSTVDLFELYAKPDELRRLLTDSPGTPA